MLVLYGWHWSVLFDARGAHPLVHALQHSSFIAIGVLVWWSVLEPKRRRLRGRAVEDRHVLSARFLGMFLGMNFVLSATRSTRTSTGAASARWGSARSPTSSWPAR